MVWFGSGFVDVVVDDLIWWRCFPSFWVSIHLFGFDLHVLLFGGGDLGFFFFFSNRFFFVFVCQENLWVWGLVRIWV